MLVKGAHPNLMPDLTASLDVELARASGVLVVPRDAVVMEGEEAFVRVRRGGRFERQDVTIGALNTHEDVITRGLQEGATAARNAQFGARRIFCGTSARSRARPSP